MRMMKLLKIVGLFTLSMTFFLMIGCADNSAMADKARSVDYTRYGALSDDYGYGGYRLEDFMSACETIVVFGGDGNEIIANCNGWLMKIESYEELNFDEEKGFRCTQITLSREGLPSEYVFGHIKGGMPRIMTQPEQVLVRDASLQPWKQRIEKTTLERLITLMTSGNLWEDNDDPLDGLGFSYIEITTDGQKYIHRADGEKVPMTNGEWPDTVTES